MTTAAMEPDLSRIRWKLTGRYVLISGFVLLVFGVVVFLEVSRARSALLREQVQQLASAAASQMPLILHEVEEYNQLPNQQLQLESGHVALLESRASTLDTKKIVLFNKDRQILSEYGELPTDLKALQSLKRPNERQSVAVPNGVGYWRPVYLRESTAANRELEGYVFSALSTATSDRELVRLRNGLVVGGAVGALAAAMLSQWMVRSSLKPIRDQLQRLMRFSSDASHELRHPLTAIRAVIGAARERGQLDRAEPELSHKLNRIDQAAAEMTRLVDDLLLLTRLDRAAPDQQHWQRFDLCDLAEDLAALYQDRAASQHLQLRCALQRPAMVHGHPDQLRRLVSNLLVNAMQFTPAGGAVSLQVHSQGQQVSVVIKDDGPGIPVEQRALVFERFWQADASRSGSNTGLGLSIARSITQVHGGLIEAQSARSGGCRMVALLPAAS
jgi:signal transduction histidine kinase